jgi:pyruvate carboxylase
VTLRVAEGDEVQAGDPVAVLEAMKMESTVTAPAGGTVRRVPVPSGTRLEQGDLIAVVAASGEA